MTWYYCLGLLRHTIQEEQGAVSACSASPRPSISMQRKRRGERLGDSAQKESWSSFSIARFIDRSYNQEPIPYLWYWKSLPSINLDTVYISLFLSTFFLYHLFLPLSTVSSLSSSSFFKEHRNQLWANLRGPIKAEIFFAPISVFQITPCPLIAASYISSLLIFCWGHFSSFLVPAFVLCVLSEAKVISQLADKLLTIRVHVSLLIQISFQKR